MRARIKAIEDMPDWIKCCDTIKQLIVSEGQLILTNVFPVGELYGECNFCHRPFGKHLIYRHDPLPAKGKGFDSVIPLELIDLDEGEE